MPTPSPRRVFLGTLATGLALGGNFLGITGKPLNGVPDVAESLRLVDLSSRRVQRGPTTRRRATSSFIRRITSVMQPW